MPAEQGDVPDGDGAPALQAPARSGAAAASPRPQHPALGAPHARSHDRPQALARCPHDRGEDSRQPRQAAAAAARHGADTSPHAI